MIWAAAQTLRNVDCLVSPTVGIAALNELSSGCVVGVGRVVVHPPTLYCVSRPGDYAIYVFTKWQAQKDRNTSYKLLSPTVFVVVICEINILIDSTGQKASRGLKKENYGHICSPKLFFFCMSPRIP